MARQLDIVTLDGAARDFARNWLTPDIAAPSGKSFRAGPGWVMECLFNMTFMDEFDYVVPKIKEYLGSASIVEFEKRCQQVFKPRDEKLFHKLLLEHLAIDPDGEHVKGAIGRVQRGNRIVGTRLKPIRTRNMGQIVLAKNSYWPIYAGEEEERQAGRIRDKVGVGVGADPLPPPNSVFPEIIGGATNPNISAECAILAADAIVDNLDEGTTAATIRGRSGAQPVDPDAAESGTLLFTLTMSDPAFGAAADGTPGGLATASAITDDSSADASGTLGYCRVGATGTGADDHIDGEAGTSASDYNFNTLAITLGSTVSMTSFTVTVPQGATAT
jgi:hypothetical protein